MDRRFQITRSGALLAAFWVAVWFAVAMFRLDQPLGLLFLSVCRFLLIMPPAAAFGALVGHPMLGFLCGSVSGIAMVSVTVILY
jgi:hypothetical protein